MTHNRFEVGDEVTIVTPVFGENSNKFTHLIVERIAGGGSQVILADKPKWRQDGRPYGRGGTYHSRFEQSLIGRIDGIQREQYQLREARAASLKRSLDGLLSYFQGTAIVRSAKKREAAIIVAEELVAFFRDPSGEGDL